MKLAALAGVTSLCGIVLLGAAGCGSGSSGSSSTTGPVPINGVYKVQLETNSTMGLPLCNGKTAGETAIVTSTSTLETCVAGYWVQIPCLVGGAVAFDSAT